MNETVSRFIQYYCFKAAGLIRTVSRKIYSLDAGIDEWIQANTFEELKRMFVVLPLVLQ